MEFVLDRTVINVPSNPPIEFAEKQLIEAKEQGATSVTSIGGGSTIDVGKYIAFNMKIPHKAIPTTCGTGSEVTKFAVFIKDGKKFSMEDPKLIPTSYEIHPELTITLPTEVTISSGLDALSQAIESWFSPKATTESRSYADQAVELVLEHLEKSVKDPANLEHRAAMMKAATLSGKAINFTRTSICHAISYSLTLDHTIPHGMACAMTLPIFMKEYSHALSFDCTEQVEDMLSRLGVQSIKDTPIRSIRKGILQVIEAALLSKRSKNVPLPVTDKVLQQLI